MTRYDLGEAEILGMTWVGTPWLACNMCVCRFAAVRGSIMLQMQIQTRQSGLAFLSLFGRDMSLADLISTIKLKSQPAALRLCNQILRSSASSQINSSLGLHKRVWPRYTEYSSIHHIHPLPAATALVAQTRTRKTDTDTDGLDITARE